MVIGLTDLNSKAEIQDFFFQLNSLETGLDAISLIAVRGNQLISAVLINEGTTIQLPLEAFDGRPLSGPIQDLEREWQLILREADTPKVAFDPCLINLTGQRIKLHQVNIIRLEQAVSVAWQQLLGIQLRHSPKPYHAATVRQLQRTLERYERNLASEQRGLQRLLNQPTLC